MYWKQCEQTITLMEMGVTNIKRKKSRMSLVVLEWNWRYWCVSRLSVIKIDVDVIEINMCVLIDV